MPNTKSAKKRLIQNQARRGRNRAARSLLKTQVRKVREAVAEGKLDVAEAEFKVTASKLDRAGKHKLIAGNKADRTKSRLQGLIKKAKQATQKV